jgi:hypothetical protein
VRGQVDNGEVEDYQVTLIDPNSPAAIELAQLDFSSLVIGVEGEDLVIREAGGLVFAGPSGGIRPLRVADPGRPRDFQIEPAALPVDASFTLTTAGARVMRLIGEDQTLDLRSLTDAALRGIDSIDLSGPGAHQLFLDPGEITNLTGPGRLRLLFDERDSFDTQVTFDFIGAERQDDRLAHVFAKEGSTLVFAGPNDWTNPILLYDVNHDGRTSALDALDVINELARRRFSEMTTGLFRDLGESELQNLRFYDVNRDDAASALDALLVINQLARIDESGLMTAESVSASRSSTAIPAPGPTMFPASSPMFPASSPMFPASSRDDDDRSGNVNLDTGRDSQLLSFATTTDDHVVEFESEWIESTGGSHETDPRPADRELTADSIDAFFAALD